MAKPTYDKPPVTISDQLDILDEKGMTIADMAFARHALETIGYYRFTGYAYTFRDQADNSSYLEGTTFEQVMNLYEFDRELKQILFGYIERIEIAFRAKVIDVMSVGYGNGQWFTDDSLFFNSVEHQEFLNKMKDDVDSSMDTLESDLASLFAKYPFADKRKNTYLGFPDDWHSDKGVWQ